MTRSVSPRHASKEKRPFDGTEAAPKSNGLLVSAPDAIARLAEAEDTLRAIGAGEIDAFVVSDRGAGQRVFTLTTADRPYRIFVENMRDGAATISPDGVILYANKRLGELLACPRDLIVGSSFARFQAGEAAVGVKDLQGRAGLGSAVELDLQDTNGATFPALVNTSPLELDGDELTCLTVTDLTAQRAQDLKISRLSEAQALRMVELQEAQAALTEQATHDPLTGLPNRAVLVDRINQALAHAKRTGRLTAVYFVDLDRFKKVNDTHGHAAGDVVLQRVAAQLLGVVRPMDTVARIGGDEYAILTPEIDDHLQAVDVGNRILAALSCRPDPPTSDERIAASIGVSVAVHGRGTAETLLQEADAAMYQSKALGGERAEIYDADLDRQARQRLAAQEMLQAALDEDRIVAHYQPIIDISTGAITGFEALARLTGPDGALHAPALFISIAEASGLVVPLDAHVLRLACREARRWHGDRVSTHPLTVAVNLSARQFESGNLPTLVQDVLTDSGLDPRCLHFELTETAIMDLHADTLQQLARLRDLGVEIGLDDFGTGYASLLHLRRLPLTFVKIDQTFVSGLRTGDDDERIVAAVVDLSANLGLTSIAEGVETTDQLDCLRELGCVQAQGYLIARPVPPEGVRAVLQELSR